MPVSFTIKTTAPGVGSSTVTTKKASQATKTIVDECESVVSKACIMAAKGAQERTNDQKIYIAAMFFQWVVSRTPLDEKWVDSKGRVHNPDDNVVKKDWHISYGNAKFNYNDFPGCFETFNDTESIKQIARIMSSRINTKRTIRTFKVRNDNDHFKDVEYGTYTFDSKEIKTSDSGRKHGVINKFSVQAPRGMLRYTEAELDWIVNYSGMISKQGLLARAESLRNMKQIPDKRRTKAIFNYMKTKKKLKESDLEIFK